MCNKNRRFSPIMLALAAVLAPAAWAADTVCKTIGTGSSSAIIAVASNFYAPAQDMVRAFQLTSDGADTTITVCQNSTTHLLAEINNGTALPLTYFPSNIDPGFPRYDFFFAADESPANLEASVGFSSFSYAMGQPVLFAKKSVIGSESGLIYNQSGHVRSEQNLWGYEINTATIGTMAVASDAAPYGKKAHAILNVMKPLYDYRQQNNFAASASLPNYIPSWVRNPLYDNISVTYDAVMNGTDSVKAGFVSLAQVCGETKKSDADSSIVYVKFTNPAYTLNQKAIQLKSANSNPARPVADALYSYIQTQMSNGGWATFCDTNCYGQP